MTLLASIKISKELFVVMSANINPLSLKTLVLNADYRPLQTWPLSLISGQEAIRAVFRGRATVVENWDAVFRSPSRQICVPKVVALNEYAPIEAKPRFCRRSILLRDRFRCQYCGKKFPSHELTFDHVIPRAAGGKTSWENILSACVSCNTRKRDSLPNFSGKKCRSEGAMRPLKQPRQPTTIELLRAGLEFLDPAIREDYASWLYWSAELKA